MAAAMMVATTLFGVKLADIVQRDVTNTETTIMRAVWGPERPCRATEVMFALLLPGHRVAPSMVVPYKGTQGTAHAVAQASSRRRNCPRPRPLLVGRYMNSRGWTGAACEDGGNGPCRARGQRCTSSKEEYSEHQFHESLRGSELASLEMRRPHVFGGMEAWLDRDLTLYKLNI